jgi:hypothetical protein
VFQGWESFYGLIGSASASLTGLLFVVVTLTQARDRSQALRGASIYMTPTVLNFAVVLSTSAVATAPRLGTMTTALVLGLGVLVGLAHAIWACIGIRGRVVGAAHWSDFWLYGAAPLTIYIALSASCVALWTGAHWAVRAIAVLLLALLLAGIRNAWDLVTWIAPTRNASAGQ